MRQSIEMCVCVHVHVYLITLQCGYGWTAVICAAMGGHTHTVEALIARGADIDAQDEVS